MRRVGELSRNATTMSTLGLNVPSILSQFESGRVDIPGRNQYFILVTAKGRGKIAVGIFCLNLLPK